jgi:hypothetical protein
MDCRDVPWCVTNVGGCCQFLQWYRIARTMRTGIVVVSPYSYMAKRVLIDANMDVVLLKRFHWQSGFNSANTSSKTHKSATLATYSSDSDRITICQESSRIHPRQQDVFLTTLTLLEQTPLCPWFCPTNCSRSQEVSCLHGTASNGMMCKHLRK